MVLFHRLGTVQLVREENECNTGCTERVFQITLRHFYGSF